MMLNLTLRAKLYLATAGAVAALLVMAGVAWYGNTAANAALAQVVEKNVKPLLALQTIDRQLKEVRFRVAGVMLDQMPAPGSRQHLAAARAAIPQAWRDYQANAAVGEAADEEKDAVARLDRGLAGIDALFDKLDRAYASADDKKELGGILEDDWPGVTTNIMKPMDQLIAIRDRDVAATYEASRALGRRLDTMALAIFALALAAMAVIAAATVRGITHSVREFQATLARVAGGDLTVSAKASGRDEIAAMAQALNQALAQLRAAMGGVHQASRTLTSASQDLSAQARDVRRDAEHQAGGVMRISASMQELTVSVGEISEGAAKVSTAAELARDVAAQGVALMQASRQATDVCLKAAASSSAAVAELSGSIARVDQVATVIDEIASQTNLLALNAAIEAARAGEQGRGFAVVADEVRKLAERTSKSTADIADMVRAIQAQAQTSVKAMNEVNRAVEEDADKIARLEVAFAEITRAAKDVAAITEEIAQATRGQRQVSELTAQDMETISQAIERSSNTIARVAGNAAETADTAATLQSLVAKFRLA